MKNFKQMASTRITPCVILPGQDTIGSSPGRLTGTVGIEFPFPKLNKIIIRINAKKSLLKILDEQMKRKTTKVKSKKIR